MKEVTNYRHVENKDYGTFTNKDGQEQAFDNVAILSIDQADKEWAFGKPQIDKIPMDLITQSIHGFTPADLPSLIGKHFVIEKEAKLIRGELNEKVVGIYFFD